MTLGLGIVLAVWPDETLVVCAVLIAIQLLISGVFRIVTAIAASGLDTALRVLSGLTGALALIVGLLFLRDPLQTVLVIGLILGAWWVAVGVIDIIGAMVSPTAGRRGWDIAGGVEGLQDRSDGLTRDRRAGSLGVHRAIEMHVSRNTRSRAVRFIHKV